MKTNADTLSPNLLHNVDSSWRTANDFFVQLTRGRLFEKTLR
jgi:hypothetical protein